MTMLLLASSSSCSFAAQVFFLRWRKKNGLLFGLHSAHNRIQPLNFTGPVQAAASLPSSLEVQARISTASSTGRLDLSDCGLDEVPSQVFSITDLVELSLAGNKITQVPDNIERLTNLRRLALAGNWICELPANIGKLQQLEYLFVQGNLLCHLPEDIGYLGNLRVLALAGNILQELPDSISCLTNLEVLSIPGNKVEKIPSDVGKLTALEVLALNGNYLQSLPLSMQTLTSLEDLWLQGNQIESIPSDFCGMRSLRRLSVADNSLLFLPESIGEMQSLESLWLYGNKITNLPHSIGNLNQLQNLWLEGNPLNVEYLSESLLLASQLKAIGVDSLVGLSEKPQVRPGKPLQCSKIAGTGLASSLGGYFKLQESSEVFPNHSQAEVVVVAFGSAPGVPNWGGVLRRIRADMVAGNIRPAFDILYVVDSRRSWYTENKNSRPWQGSGEGHQPSELSDDSSIGGPAQLSNSISGKIEAGLSSYYRKELEAALKKYKRVVMLGDSMGASAALMFSSLATSVIAFCPQVDLVSSCIRPGRGSSWLSIFNEELMDAVMASSAHITVHCGSWGNDLYQAKLLPGSKVDLVAHSIDDHRLAKELDRVGSLQTLVRSKLEEEIILAHRLL